jgi:hypothetical protein
VVSPGRCRRGAANAFDFGAQFDQGGYLVATATWTRDGGNGIDDFFAAISSRGQIALYQGTDPSSANTWAKVGVFNVGAPIGRRCFTKVGADLAIITVDGVLPMSQALGLDRAAAERIAITARISDAMNKAARLYKENFGWQLISYPKGTAALLNVPVTSTASHQYVMNTLTGAWCRFTGQNAHAWALLGDDLYFGGEGGIVFKADEGGDDNGTAIAYDLMPAWNHLGKPGQLKQVDMMALLLGTDGTITPAIEMLTDFRQQIPTSSSSSAVAGGSDWDEDDWDVAEWGSEEDVLRIWTATAATGVFVAPRVKGTASGAAMKINSFDLTYKLGAMV